MMMACVFESNATQSIDLRAGRACRLTAKVLEAFSFACDLQDLETAEALLKTVEEIVVREGVDAVRQWGAAQNLVDAHYRLLEMRQQEQHQADRDRSN